MAKQVAIRPRARLDLIDQAAFLDRQSPAVAFRFLFECDATFNLLVDTPGIGGPYLTTDQRLVGVRVFPIRGFPNHLAFYIDKAAGIEIIRVLHGARDLDAALQDI